MLEGNSKLTTVEHLRVLSLKRELVAAQTFQEEFLLSFAEREEAIPLHLAFPNRHWLDTKAARMTGRGFYHSPTGLFSSSPSLVENAPSSRGAAYHVEGGAAKKKTPRKGMGSEKTGGKRKRGIEILRRGSSPPVLVEDYEESSSSHSGGGKMT